jgi:hypothetical protein
MKLRKTFEEFWLPSARSQSDWSTLTSEFSLQVLVIRRILVQIAEEGTLCRTPTIVRRTQKCDGQKRIAHIRLADSCIACVFASTRTMILFSTPFTLLVVLLSGGIAYASHHTTSDSPLENKASGESAWRSLIDDSGGAQEVQIPVGPPVTAEQVREFAEAVDRFYHGVGRPGTSFQKTITVDVNFVIVNNTANQGITQGQMLAQIDILNNAFQPDFEFNLKFVQFVQSDLFFSGVTFPDLTVLTQLATAHHRGGMETLNVYVTGIQGTAGIYFDPFSNAGVLDGVYQRFNTVPGGTDLFYSQGKVSSECKRSSLVARVSR